MYDLFSWLCGDNPTRVYATAVSGRLKKEGMNVCDSVQVKIEYDSGCSFSVDLCWILPERFDNA